MNASIKTIERSLTPRVTARRVANWGVLMVALGQVACDDDPKPWAIADGGVDASVTADGGGGEPTSTSSDGETTDVVTDTLTAVVPNGSGGTVVDAGASSAEPSVPDASESSAASSTATSSETLATSTDVVGTETSVADSSTTEGTSTESTSEPTAESTSSGEAGDAGTPQYANCYDQCSVDCFPDCLKDLFAGCAPSGACNQDNGSYCWENQSTATESGDIFTGYTRTIFAPGGDACYSAFRSTDLETFVASFTWSDADSNVVATASWDLNQYTMRLTCADSGVVWDFEPPGYYCDAVDEYGWSVASCEPGSCPIQAGDAGIGVTSEPGDASAPPAFH